MKICPTVVSNRKPLNVKIHVPQFFSLAMNSRFNSIYPVRFHDIQTPSNYHSSNGPTYNDVHTGKFRSSQSFALSQVSFPLSGGSHVAILCEHYSLK